MKPVSIIPFVWFVSSFVWFVFTFRILRTTTSPDPETEHTAP